MPDSADLVSDIEVIKQRKKEGIDIPLTKNVQAKDSTTYLEFVKLIHNALPELDFEEIDTTCSFLKHSFSAPILIDCMTGGTPEATKINMRLGQIAEKFQLCMGVGSQRAGLKSNELRDTYHVARANAPNAFLIANIGGAQLSKGLSIDEIENIIEMIRANALAIHLNPLQELIQPEGEPRYSGVLAKITELCKNLKIPVIVKEVGAGISKDVASRLESSGIAAINVAGSGGTSWAGVEKERAQEVGNQIKTHLGELFWDWGIPTALSLIEVTKTVNIPIIASGGLRNGLEIAKCLALGADACALAYPFLRHASESFESLNKFTNTIITELRSTMFLVGSKDIFGLKKSRYMLTGDLARVILE